MSRELRPKTPSATRTYGAGAYSDGGADVPRRWHLPPALAASLQYPVHMAPVPLAAPTGERALGLALRVAL